MSDVTRILSQIESGDPLAAEQLLPLVYEELRKLAAAKLAFEKPGQTLQRVTTDVVLSCIMLHVVCSRDGLNMRSRGSQ